MTLTAEQLEMRKSGIGASEMPAIMGEDPYRTAIDIYLEKTSKAPPFEGNQYTYWGNVLEPAIAQRYAELNGVELVESDTLVHQKHSWMMATPDRIVMVDPRRGLECKNRGAYSVFGKQWGEPGTDEVPNEVAIQCHASMEVTGFKRWDAAVLIGGNDWSSYVLEYDKVIAESMVEVAHDFWHEHVLKDICPELDGSESSANYVASKWQKHGELIVPADEKTASTAEQLREVRALIKEYGESEERYKNLIKDAIGEAAGVELPDGKKITWKRPKASQKTNWEAVARFLGDSVPEAYFDEAVKRHTKETEPSRRFLCPRNW